MKKTFNLLGLLAIGFTFALSGCDRRDEKSVNLGQQYVLLRLSEGVTIEDLTMPHGGGVPSEVFSVGFNADFIIAYSLANQTTNVWVITKSNRTTLGPFTLTKFEEYKASNSAVITVKQKNVWKL